jgi:hypothetical protein
MNEFIARENIRKFEEKLAACSDPEQRKVLSLLLEAERQHLEEAIREKTAEAQQNAMPTPGRPIPNS